MIFRARLTRAARATLCVLLIVSITWAVQAVARFDGIDNTLRSVAVTPMLILGVALLVGIWRLWVVCLIVDESGLIVRNFRGDIRLRRNEIREVYAVTGYTGCHVALRLKIGDELHLEGLAFATAGRTNQAVAEITEAMASVRPRAES